MNDKTEKNRAVRRSRVLKEGLASFHHESSSFPCQIRDMSDGGAKLIFDEVPTLPARFYLHVPVDGTKYSVAIRWIDGRSCGVQFVGPAETSNLKRSQFFAPPDRSDPSSRAAPAKPEPGEQEAPPSRRRPKPTFGRLK